METKKHHQLNIQLKQASTAIDLIKISQRSQHTSIKEALRKMLRSISMIAEAMDGKIPININKDLVTKTSKELMEKARQIRERRKKNDTNKTKSEKEGG